MKHPYDIFNLITGPATLGYAPATVSVAKKLQDFISLLSKDDYKAAEKYDFFGAAAEGEAPSYSRGFESDGLGIEQESSAVLTSITDVNHGFSLNIAEIEPENIKMVEGIELGAGTSETVAATETTSKQEVVPIGSLTEVPRYRMFLIGERKIESGEVIEPDGTVRGRLVAVYLNRVALTADDSEIEWGKDGLASAAVQFEGFPEPGLKGAEAYGRWFFEAAGKIGK